MAKTSPTSYAPSAEALAALAAGDTSALLELHRSAFGGYVMEKKTSSNPLLQRAYDDLDTCERTIVSVMEQAQDRDSSDLSDAENSLLKDTEARMTSLRANIATLERVEAVRVTDAETASRYAPGNGATHNAGQAGGSGGGRSGTQTKTREHQYRTRGQVVVDLISLRTGTYESPGAKRRISDEAAAQARDRLMGAGVPFQGAPDEYLERIVNAVTGDVPGIMPEPIVGTVDTDLDAARPFISSIGGGKDMSDIPGKVFTRPIITGHTQVGKQAAEKAELASRKLTIDGVDFTKETYGGTIDVARQLIDWSSPSAWDALIQDLQDEYAIETENAAADAFATAVTAAVDAPVTDDLKGWATALYGAAALSYGGVRRLPNHIWVSLDQWAAMGSIVDAARIAIKNGEGNSLGSSNPGSFAGNVFDLDRTVVPSFPDGTVIVGVKEKTEFYEQRVGLLTAVEPRLLGVEIAFGGYVAYGTIRPAGFAKIPAFVAGP